MAWTHSNTLSRHLQVDNVTLSATVLEVASITTGGLTCDGACRKTARQHTTKKACALRFRWYFPVQEGRHECCAPWISLAL